MALEFEQIVEQLEGVDLAALARRHEEGVMKVRKGVFETTRARAAGLRVYREVYGETDPAVEAAFGGVRKAWHSIRSAPRSQTASKTHDRGPNRRPDSPAG